MTPTGRKRWALSMPGIPSRSTGEEPTFTSHDALALLNVGDTIANVRITLFYEAHGEVGPFRLGVAPRRVRRVRVNDLVFPEAVRLEEPYAMIVECDVPIVAQLTRCDTRAAAAAGFATLAFPAA